MCLSVSVRVCQVSVSVGVYALPTLSVKSNIQQSVSVKPTYSSLSLACCLFLTSFLAQTLVLDL